MRRKQQPYTLRHHLLMCNLTNCTIPLTLSCRTTYMYMSYRTANLQMLHFIYYSTNIRTEYIKHAAHSTFFSSSKCRLFHNATFFGSRVIHILYTVCAKIKKKKFRRQRVKQCQNPSVMSLQLNPVFTNKWAG